MEVIITGHTVMDTQIIRTLQGVSGIGISLVGWGNGFRRVMVVEERIGPRPLPAEDGSDRPRGVLVRLRDPGKEPVY